MSSISKYTFVGMLTPEKPPTVEAVVEGLKMIGFDLEDEDELTPQIRPSRMSTLTSTFFLSFDTTDRYLAGRLDQFVKSQKPVLHEGKQILLVPRTAPRFSYDKALFLASLEFELPPDQQTCIFSRAAWDGKEHRQDWMLTRIDDHLEEAKWSFKAVCRDVKKHVRFCLEKGGRQKNLLG